MITKTIKGDLVKLAKNGEFDVIVHGCNCFCNMGAGIAKQIKNTWAEVYHIDCSTKTGSRDKLGTVSLCMVEKGHLDVINAYTQFNYGGKKPVSYSAISSCFLKINNWYKGVHGIRIGIPKIGAGLAGGDWDVISKIIDGCTPDIDITLVEYCK